MEDKIQIALTDGTWIEGTRAKGDGLDPGVYVKDAHRCQGANATPIAKLAFVPYSNILFIVLEE